MSSSSIFRELPLVFSCPGFRSDTSLLPIDWTLGYSTTGVHMIHGAASLPLARSHTCLCSYQLHWCHCQAKHDHEWQGFGMMAQTDWHSGYLPFISDSLSNVNVKRLLLIFSLATNYLRQHLTMNFCLAFWIPLPIESHGELGYWKIRAKYTNQAAFTWKQELRRTRGLAVHMPWVI